MPSSTAVLLLLVAQVAAAAVPWKDLTSNLSTNEDMLTAVVEARVADDPKQRVRKLKEPKCKKKTSSPSLQPTSNPSSEPSSLPSRNPTKSKGGGGKKAKNESKMMLELRGDW